MTDNSKLTKNFEGQKTKKGKEGKYCPFRQLNQEGNERKCGNYCALFCDGLRSCVFHAINLNLSKIRPLDKDLPEQKD